eukprot:g1554.t1
MNDAWMEQECYVRSQSRFHPALPVPAHVRERYNLPGKEDFKDPNCLLSCQCEKIAVKRSQTGSVKGRQFSDCVYEIANMCVTDGTFRQSINYHDPDAFDEGGMFRACSEVGQTLFKFEVSPQLYPQHVPEERDTVAFLLPVTFKLTSTWHGLHSLIPPFVMLFLEPEKYGLGGTNLKQFFSADDVVGRHETRAKPAVDLFLLNQNLERDVEHYGGTRPWSLTIWSLHKHWNKLLGFDTMRFDGRYGWFARFLEAFQNVNIYSQGFESVNRCYKKVVFGHELMMYSGGGYTEAQHVQFFTRKMRNFFLGGGLLRKRAALERLGRDPDAKPFYRGRAKGGDENDANTVYTYIEEDAEIGKTTIVEYDWGFRMRKKLFLIQDRLPGKSFHRFVENMADVKRYIELALPADEWVIEAHDFAALDFVEQVRLASKARVMFGAHGDGLAWGLFMPPNSVVMEAVPLRRGGYQVCDEGMNKNKRGIFGGLLKFAKNITHLCWTNPRGKNSAMNITSDVYDWNWRMLNLEIDMMKVAHWLRTALWTVDHGISDEKYEHIQTALLQFYQEKGEYPPGWG